MLALRTTLATATLALLAASVRAAEPIEIEVAAVPGAPMQELQTWARVLGRMDLARVTLRAARGNEQPEVTTSEYGGVTRYKVRALLSRNNELVLPGGRFSLGDSAKLSQHLHDLPDSLDEASIERGRFGLTEDDFAKLLHGFSETVDESTVDAPRNAWLQRQAGQLPAPCEWSPVARRALADDRPLGIDLKGLSRGAALAIALRQQGLALFPQQHRREPLKLRIDALADLGNAWPVGWKPAKSARQVIPQAYEATTVEIANYSLAQALAALEKPLGARIVYDPWALTKNDIDPTKFEVNVPRKKLLIKSAVGACLSQARLSGELRVDEAGTVFYWVTRFGELSPRAE